MSSCTRPSASGGPIPTKLMRLPAVLSSTGKSRSTLYREIAAGLFPRSVRIGENSTAWLESEVNAWIAARVAERDGRPA